MLTGCKVTILTRTDGDTQTFSAAGQIEATAGRVATYYVQDGDRVTLRMDSKCFFMERKGDTCLSCEFRSAQQSAMRLMSENGLAEIPVKTKSYILQTDPKIIRAELVYDLIFSTQIQTFQVKLYIEISEEK